MYEELYPNALGLAVLGTFGMGLSIEGEVQSVLDSKTNWGILFEGNNDCPNRRVFICQGKRGRLDLNDPVYIHYKNNTMYMGRVCRLINETLQQENLRFVQVVEGTDVMIGVETKYDNEWIGRLSMWEFLGSVSKETDDEAWITFGTMYRSTKYTNM